jgi:hypothetical protein
LKDIENSKLLSVQGALQRLDKALMRLEAGAATPGGVGESKALQEKLDEISRAHSTLQETAGRVAARLDTAIERLASSI